MHFFKKGFLYYFYYMDTDKEALDTRFLFMDTSALIPSSLFYTGGTVSW